ncbi:Propionyl-CoA carboxylase alpha chain, mitochondrial [Smittium culicis]|uniref:Propionyl-CoA carboxylase alpha chain, mitochondrial n=1 Tax=Smittium culicis TaxID=133412 RepID=A0A1R1X4X2_9FUNG|nr:Propionyl-CoA carboxylase alpha chain, mitochondrial [Smittium culicis]
MGIKTVAIYSDADAESLHVKLADEAVRVGPAPTSQSYLNIPVILDAITQTGAQAVHPGYGFLSENSAFVKELEARNVSFIGPNEYAMHAMGDKIQSKIIAKEAGVNVIPGFNGVVKDVQHAVTIANEVGYPIMLKASAGGGGKGMRIARNDAEVEEAFRLCTEEAKSSFGDSRLLVERFIDQPRHIEIQIIADKNGNCLYLPERECSIQRRNQKVIEEAPSPFIDPETRRAMGEQAVALSKNVGYTSAGTVEFLVDSNRQFYFLEMNTRLQVEHPITEYITGFDLVEEMIRSSAGLNLTTTNQSDVKINGWAIESRVYAEDPEHYLPSIGTLSKYTEPTNYKLPNDVRCDSGITEGSEISMYYDPMICKLSTFGKTRQDATETMKRSLDNYLISGVNHNIPLLRDVVSHPAFASGDLFTGFLAKYYPNGFKGYQLKDTSSATGNGQNEFAELAATSAALQLIINHRDMFTSKPNTQTYPKKFIVQIPQTNSDDSISNTSVELTISPKSQNSPINFTGINEFNCIATTIPSSQESPNAPGLLNPLNCTISTEWSLGSPFIKVSFSVPSNPNYPQSTFTVQYLEKTTLGFVLQYKGTKFNLNVISEFQQNMLKFMKPKPKLDTSNLVIAPMPGTIVSISVSPGQKVSEGMEVAVIEAMKMQNVLRAPKSGIIKSILVEQGSAVSGDDILIELEK